MAGIRLPTTPAISNNIATATNISSGITDSSSSQVEKTVPQTTQKRQHTIARKRKKVGTDAQDVSHRMASLPVLSLFPSFDWFLKRTTV
jgi:hypothetical protein